MNLIRPNGLFALVVIALTISACSKTEKPQVEAAVVEEDVIDNTDIDDGSPSRVVTPDVSAEPLPGDFSGDQNGLVQYVGGDKVFFALDSSELNSRARQILEKQAEFLRYYARASITVEGHCDERGTREYNLALGERRANAVKEYLVALGVRSGRLNTVSYGKERPIVSGSGESVWSQNRRAVSVISR